MIDEKPSTLTGPFDFSKINISEEEEVEMPVLYFFGVTQEGIQKIFAFDAKEE